MAILPVQASKEKQVIQKSKSFNNDKTALKEFGQEIGKQKTQEYEKRIKNLEGALLLSKKNNQELQNQIQIWENNYNSLKFQEQSIMEQYGSVLDEIEDEKKPTKI